MFYEAGLLFLLVAWQIDRIRDKMLLQIEFRSQFSTGNCSQLFTSTVHHDRQNYCLHFSLLCFGSQLFSKQKYIWQISLESEKYNLKKSIHRYIRQHSNLLSQEDFNYIFGMTWRMICEMYRTTHWESLMKSFGLQLTIV